MVVMGAIWFVALRPSTSSPTPTANAPGVKGLSTAVDKANQAAATSAASNAATQAAANAVDGSAAPAANQASPTSSAAPSSAPARAAAPARTHVHVSAGDRSGPLLDDLAEGKVVVVAFAGNRAADDRGVRKALARVDRLGGKVVVRIVSIGNVAKYGAITRGVQVDHSPTVLVIGHDNQAHSIVGFTDTREIDQLVSDTARKTKN